MVKTDILLKKNKMFEYTGMRIKGKFYYEVRNNFIAGKIPYSKIFIISIGPKTELRSLDCKEAKEELYTMEALVKEFREYNLITLVIRQACGHDIVESDLDTILASKSFYRLTVKRHEDNLSSIERLLQNA